MFSPGRLILLRLGLRGGLSLPSGTLFFIFRPADGFRFFCGSLHFPRLRHLALALRYLTLFFRRFSAPRLFFSWNRFRRRLSLNRCFLLVRLCLLLFPRNRSRPYPVTFLYCFFYFLNYLPGIRHFPGICILPGYRTLPGIRIPPGIRILPRVRTLTCIRILPGVRTLTGVCILPGIRLVPLVRIPLVRAVYFHRLVRVLRLLWPVGLLSPASSHPVSSCIRRLRGGNLSAYLLLGYLLCSAPFG